MSEQMDDLVEKAARAMYESDHPAYVASGLTWDHVVVTVPKSADTWRRYATAALESIGLPALLERVEAAEGEVARLKRFEPTATSSLTFNERISVIRHERDKLKSERDALAAKVADHDARLARVEALADKWDADCSPISGECTPTRHHRMLRAALALDAS